MPPPPPSPISEKFPSAPPPPISKGSPPPPPPTTFSRGLPPPSIPPAGSKVAPAYTLTFTLPSLHDSTPLFCTIHHPPSFPPTSSHPPPHLILHPSTSTLLPTPRGIAILAHPYAPLGGSSSDPVLALATFVFLAAGYIVLTFDFRGAGRSGGKTSWTAGPETADYVSVVGCGIGYLTWLNAGMNGCGGWEGRNGGDGSDGVRGRGGQRGGSGGSGVIRTEPFGLVLGGYSYGSLIVQKLPPPRELLHRFLTITADSREALLDEQAQTLVADYLARSGQQSQQSTQRPSVPSIAFSYLLISPLLWPLSAALTLQVRGLDTDKARGGHKTLAVFGGQDGFTSVPRLEKWARARASRDSSSFTYQLVEEAGHFWRELGVAGNLQEAVRMWLELGCASSPPGACVIDENFG